MLLAAAVFLYLGARESIAALPGAAQRARACAAAAVRVHEIAATEPEIRDCGHPATVGPGLTLAADRVTFGYDTEDPPVLR